MHSIVISYIFLCMREQNGFQIGILYRNIREKSPFLYAIKTNNYPWFWLHFKSEPLRIYSANLTTNQMFSVSGTQKSWMSMLESLMGHIGR